MLLLTLSLLTMPDLLTSLQKHDLGHLRIVARFWGLELASNKIESATKDLSASLLDPDLLAEILEALNPEARAALEALVIKNGRMPWPEFIRLYGEIREVGPGKRDREQLPNNPVSAAEALFYRALLSRAFFDTAKGPQEFAFIPDDLLELIHRNPSWLGQGGHSERQKQVKIAVGTAGGKEPLGRPALPRERGHITPASDRILDAATSLLAALRLEIEPPETSVPVQVLKELLNDAKIVTAAGPEPEAVKGFLEAPREVALKMLIDAWLASESFDELRQLPRLIFEGEWKNQPAVTREFLLNLLGSIPIGKWWSLSAFISDVKAKYPDFQRPSGDYDSWFIKRESDGEYLRGYEYWDQVDGAMISYCITSILFWLGQVDLAAPDEGGEPTAFRVTGDKLKIKSEGEKLIVRSNGQIASSRLVPRVVRYQVARFCEWDAPKADVYQYHLTPASLKRAGEQGLKVEHLLSLLAKHAAGGIPPVLVKALKRWAANGTEARIQTHAVLKVNRPEVLEELRKSRANRFLGEILGPTAVVVKKNAQPKILAALAELGMLAEEEK